MASITKRQLRQSLLDWYRAAGRDLPWRRDAAPYRVWVSEIMLQQTRVEAVIPYYERWMERFPTVQTLADASQQEVLAAWEGLGYYSRARNLHKAARLIRDRYEGAIPQDADDLQDLPGIGRYTAGAIASIAFDLDEPVVDGNIRRVFSRLFDIEKPIGSAEAEAAFWSLAAENLPSGQAGEFNQALMDLGAVVCLPKNPRCGSCPVSGICQARRLGIQDQRPVRKPRREIPHYTVAAAVIEDGERVLITRRPQDALLGGMWEFPGGKIRPDEALEEGLQREIKEELGVQVRVGEACGTYHHAYTHYRITLHAFRCRLAGGRPEPLEVDEIQWAHFDDLTEYPMGKIDRMISSTIQK